MSSLRTQNLRSGKHQAVAGSAIYWRCVSLIRQAASCALALTFLLTHAVVGDAQNRRIRPSEPQSSHLRVTMSPEERELVDLAIAVVCLERQRDPQGSIPIDEMQGRPSLPVRSPEAIAGAERAQRLLPIARNLVNSSLQQLAARYAFKEIKGSNRKLDQALVRLQEVKKIKPDMDSRDNASVFLRNPHTITFGTIFLAGLPSDEGMISVLAHELLHIADGDSDALQVLFRAIGNRAASLTGIVIKGQKAEELTCDLVGMMAARSFVAASPSYEPLPRRISRSVAHNCVEEDEGDEDHLSPRSTIRALLALDPSLTRELVSGKDERAPGRTNRR